MFGQNYMLPNNLSLKRLFEYYEAKLWYYAGVSLATEALKQDFIIGSHWTVANLSHGSQKFMVDEIQLDQIERCKYLSPAHLRRCNMKRFQTPQWSVTLSAGYSGRTSGGEGHRASGGHDTVKGAFIKRSNWLT